MSPVLALDLGTTKVTCAVGQPLAVPISSLGWTHQPLAVQLLGCGMAAYPTLTPGMGQTHLMAQAIEEAVAASGMTTPLDRAVVAVTHPALAHACIDAQIEVADEPATIRAHELNRLRRQAISQALGLDRDVLLLEGLNYSGNGFDHIVDPYGLCATRLRGQFHFITLPQAIRQSIMLALEAAGLELDRLSYTLKSLTSASWSLGNDVRRAPEAVSERTLIVDIGGSCTDAALVQSDRILRASTVAVGGLTVLEEVAKACHLQADHALTASLEGFTSQKPTVRKLVERALRPLHELLHGVLQQEVPPVLTIVTGRGAMIDGIVEWIETLTGIKTVLGRHALAKPLGDVSQQLAFTPVLALLENVCRRPEPRSSSRSARLFSRVVDRTKRILVEYF